MIIYSGHTFDSWTWSNSNNNAKGDDYGSPARKTIQWDGTTGYDCVAEVFHGHKNLGMPYKSTDNLPIALHLRMGLAIEDITVSDGSTLYLSYIRFCSSADLPTYSLWIHPRISNTGGTLTLQMHVTELATLGGSTVVDICTVTEGTDFYDFDFYVWRDKVSFYSNAGVLLGSVDINTDNQNVFYMRTSLYFDATRKWHLEYLTISREEANFSPTAGESDVNMWPVDGHAYLIKKTALQSLVTAGDAYKLAVTVGDIAAESADNDTDYVAAFVDTNNIRSGANKINKDSSDDWTETEWVLP